MTRKRIENKIEDLEKKQQQDKSGGVIFADKAPDGSYIDRETGKFVDDMDLPDNTVIIHLSDKTYGTY